MKLSDLYLHQQETVNFLLNIPHAFVTSDPGTGKTVSSIYTHLSRNEGKMLVVSPKTIMEAAWGNDIRKFFPLVSYGVINRETVRKDSTYLQSLFDNNEIVIINPESADLVLNKVELINYTTFVLDEFTSVKNRTTKRSRAIEQLSKNFKYRILLSGTPIGNSVTDLWHPAFILDRGARLGFDFFQFRNAVCHPTERRGNGRVFTTWEDIHGAKEAVGDMLRDITIRHKLEDVVDMPPRVPVPMPIQMPPKLRAQYEQMRDQAIVELSDDTITAVNAAIVGNKLLQIASGSIYDNQGNAVLIDSTKYELVTELVSERAQSLVFFQWKHQRDCLAQLLTSQGLEFAVIDGDTKDTDRPKIVEDFQNGKYRTLLLQPQAAAHGLTLVNSTASIWCTPTFNLEHWTQANHRDYRLGQDKRTEYIMLQYNNTIEQYVYNKLQGKEDGLNTLLTVLTS